MGNSVEKFLSINPFAIFGDIRHSKTNEKQWEAGSTHPPIESTGGNGRQQKQTAMYIVETARLGLRRLQESDLDDFHAIWSNHNAVRWTSYDVSNSAEESKAILDFLSPSLKKPEPQNYGVFLRKPSRELSSTDTINTQPPDREHMIGVVGVFRSTAAEAGYIFNESFWGQGYASEALAAFLNIHWQRATADPTLPQAVTARVDLDNLGSVKVLRKCGFQDVQCLVGDKKLGKKDLLLLQVEKPVEA